MLFVDDSAKTQVNRIKEIENLTEDYFIRVSVTSGGCSGLTYQMDFDNELQENDQVFDDNDCAIVTGKL